MKLTQAQCQRIDDLILSHLKQMDWSEYTYVHVFLAIAKFKEPDLFVFVDWLRKVYPYIQLVISRSNLQEGTMTHYVWDDNTVFVENKWGIREPAGGTQVDEQQLDVVLVPLLVADSWGHRIGYGRGFYDRFLAKCRANVKTIGVSYFPILTNRIETDKWDIALETIVTPEGSFVVKK